MRIDIEHDVPTQRSELGHDTNLAGRLKKVEVNLDTSLEGAVSDIHVTTTSRQHQHIMHACTPTKQLVTKHIMTATPALRNQHRSACPALA